MEIMSSLDVYRVGSTELESVGLAGSNLPGRRGCY